MNYQPTRHDIRIVINIKGNKRPFTTLNTKYFRNIVEPKLLMNIFDSIENALYESDRKDVMDFFNSYETYHDNLSLVRDAAIHRIREYKHNRLLINEARNGSIELETFVFAIAAIILEKTLGESIFEGYKKSNLHQQLSEFVASTIDRKTLFIAERLRKVFSSKNKNVQVIVEDMNVDRPNTIIVTVNSKEDDKSKPEITLGEIVDRQGII